MSLEDDMRAAIDAIKNQEPEPYRCPHTFPMHPRMADRFHGMKCPSCGVILMRPQVRDLQ